MENQHISLNPIGIIHTPFDKQQKPPRQGRFEPDNEGWVEIFSEYEEGLNGLKDFTHAYFIFHFHLSESYDLIQKTPRHHAEKGVFAIRSPRRPNPIGLTIVRIQRIEGNKIYFSAPDMLDGSPLLDIKPYVSEIDCYQDANNGWLNTIK
ncbi:MAG: tRNA (N6-threonylcarbamoyladenosine(37)-N6)-methyltransferase TrmO [Bacteroidales bacterium]|nr:tRNA (N6-threonylcarbamoyladenosine(37)-N6)-methyltransferase TrmO [Bacteroidales bacterium]